MKNRTKYKFTVILTAISVILAITCIVIRFREDRTPPQIYYSTTDKIYSGDLTEEELLKDVSAVDDQSGDVSSTLKIEKIYFDDKENACVVYVAKDGSNNVAKLSRIISKSQMVN